MTIRFPRYVWNQGEADRLLARGEYTTRFRQFWSDKRAQIARLTGGATAPQLYMFQTGGYCRKQDNHWMVLDQIDCVREYNAILVGPNWQVPVADANVHPSIGGHIRLYETAAWAIAETEAGRAWNLLPPTSVTRSGNTITIPISIRTDETLTTTPGKYADYGGDPAFLGLEAVGGGAVTAASVSGGNIVVEVAGTVTSIKHAHQRAAGIDYGTFTDAQGQAYVAHRSLIRTTLTKPVEVAGLAMTCERWVPSFEVPVVEEPSGFTDDFNRPDQQLEASPEWELISGTAGTGQVVSNRMVGSGTPTVTAAYRSPDMGSEDQAVQFSMLSNNAAANGATPFVTCRMSALLTGVGIRLSENFISVFKMINGTFTLLAEYSVTYVSGMVIRMEVVGTSFRVAVNGARVTPSSGSETIGGTQPASSTRQGLTLRSATLMLDDYRTEAITAFTIT